MLENMKCSELLDLRREIDNKLKKIAKQILPIIRKYYRYFGTTNTFVKNISGVAFTRFRTFTDSNIIQDVRFQYYGMCDDGYVQYLEIILPVKIVDLGNKEVLKYVENDIKNNSLKVSFPIKNIPKKKRYKPLAKRI